LWYIRLLSLVSGVAELVRGEFGCAVRGGSDGLICPLLPAETPLGAVSRLVHGITPERGPTA
jgi:hypothetical protein